MEIELPSAVRPHNAISAISPPPDGALARAAWQTEKIISAVVFASRWLQAPLYLGLVVAQAIYVIVFVRQLITLVISAGGIEDENKVMLTVLGMIDVVMISNLLIMVIVGGYQTFVAKLGIDKHPDRPEWLAHVNENTLKIKLALSLIGISSIHLLKSFIDAEHVTSQAVMWQVIIHGVFLVSASAIAFAVWLAHKGSSVQMDLGH
jgi:uncharacterized protein (TIGR00645 family)